MDASSTTLNRLLAKLDQTLQSPASEARLRRSQYERNRVAANIDHARTLLLTLERNSSTIRVQTQRQQIQADLQRKRDLIKRLGVRLQQLNELEEDDGEDEDEDDDDGEILAQYAPARLDANAGNDIGEPQGLPVDEGQASALRSRRPLQAGDNRSAASTTAREQLFAGRPAQSQSTTNMQQTESLMTHNRVEQETLTTGLLGLARALKESSLQFSSSLEAEKDVLKRAEGGLDKSALGMEAAGKRMGMLRRMAEGQGWLGRMKMYGFIAGLWVMCFLLVFIGPKLRF